MGDPTDPNPILFRHVRVGPSKPVSYLPISTVQSVLKMTVDDYAHLIEQAGCEVAVFSDAETCIKSGAVYAYSETDLASVLASNHQLLVEHDWPNTPAAFVRRVASEWLDERSPLRRVVDMAFGVHPLSIKGVVLHQGRVLLLVNERGEWDLPGGRPDPGEDHRATLVREVLEETGLGVEVGALVDEHLFEVLPQRFVRIVAYACALRGGSDVTLSDEHLEVSWVALSDIGESIAGRRIPAGYLGAIRQLISQPRSPSDREV